MHEVDWLPTFLSLAGAKPSAAGIDGVSQWEALVGSSDGGEVAPPPRTTVIYNIDPVANLSGIRVGDWKLIDGSAMRPDVRPTTSQYIPLCPKSPDTPDSAREGSAVTGAGGNGGSADCLADLHSAGPWLFNLKSDPNETTNLFASEAARVGELRAALSQAVADGPVLWPLNAPGTPGANNAPLSTTCPGGVWTPWE